jgi:hypothetical protein
MRVKVTLAAHERVRCVGFTAGREPLIGMAHVACRARRELTRMGRVVLSQRYGTCGALRAGLPGGRKRYQ